LEWGCAFFEDISVLLGVIQEVKRVYLNVAKRFLSSVNGLLSAVGRVRGSLIDSRTVHDLFFGRNVCMLVDSQI
jgi:hypothetical protein